MARVKKEVLRQREKDAWRLRVTEGKTHWQIAEALGVERSTVSKILIRLSQRSLEQLNDEVSAEKIRQIDSLDHMISELNESWKKSKEAAKIVTRKNRGGVKDGNSGDATTVRVVEQEGDPRYMTEIRGCMADKRKILGLDAATVLDVKLPENLVQVYIPTNRRPLGKERKPIEEKKPTRKTNGK